MRSPPLVVLALSVLAVAWAAGAVAATPAAAPLVMCMGQPIPSGHVIIKIAHTPTCGKTIGPNTMTLLSYTGLKIFTACGPIPVAGYVVTSAKTTPACQGINAFINGNTVSFPTYNTVTMAAYDGLKVFKACAPLTIPHGYVVTGRSATPGCKPLQAGLVPWNTLTLSAYAGLATVTYSDLIPLSR